MIKGNHLKIVLLCISMTCFGVQGIRAQLESTDRALEIRSFSKAGANDDDTRKPSNFDSRLGLDSAALIKVFSPVTITTEMETLKDSIAEMTRAGGKAFYFWVEPHINSMGFHPEGFKTLEVDFVSISHGTIEKYTLLNKNGGLQPRTVYQLVLRDPTPVYIDTYLRGTYARVDNNAQTYTSDAKGRIELKDIASGTHTVNVYASDNTLRNTITINDDKKMYTCDARLKVHISIKTNPTGGQIFISRGERQEPFDSSSSFEYGSYQVTAYINGNEVKKTITVDENHKNFTIDNTRTYTITPMYNGSVDAKVYENGSVITDTEGVTKEGKTYVITRPVGKTYTYYAKNSNYKSSKTKITVSNNSRSDYELKMSAYNSITWPWQKEYDAAPIGIAIGYVQKQLVTKGEGEKYKENGVWNDSEGKWLYGMQFGIFGQPCFSWGLGLYTGLFYELYLSLDGEDGWDSFQEHNLVVPVHALYRLRLGRKSALSLHGGIGFSCAVYGAYKADGYEDYTDFYGETGYPKRFNVALEGGLDLRFGAVQLGVLYSKGLNDHASYSSVGDYKTYYKKLGVSISYVIGGN